jgi:alpha-glucosidase
MAVWTGEAGADGTAQGWPSWAFENHDAPRAVSRWTMPETASAFVAMKIVLLVSLRGNVILYQGEELGLEQDEIPFDLLQDPEAIANWPLTLSRDGARTPMPWQADAEQGGFTSGTPWLPLGAANRARAVDQQEGDPCSLLALTREALALRRDNVALRLGDFQLLHSDAAVLAFRREAAEQALVCVFNLSSEPAFWPAGLTRNGHAIAVANGGEPGHLPAYAAVLFETTN